jgi:hypothetical protein
MSKRDLFKCIDCGLVFAGRNVAGTIYPYDRGPNKDPQAEPRKALCAACNSKRSDGILGWVRP